MKLMGRIRRIGARVGVGRVGGDRNHSIRFFHSIVRYVMFVHTPTPCPSVMLSYSLIVSGTIPGHRYHGMA